MKSLKPFKPASQFKPVNPFKPVNAPSVASAASSIKPALQLNTLNSVPFVNSLNGFKPLENLKTVNFKSYIETVTFNPFNLILENGQVTMNTYLYALIYLVIFLICFILSLTNWPSDDVTPYGHRFLYAVSAGLWNILYLIYFIFLRF